MKTVGCKGSDANFYGLSNTLVMEISPQIALGWSQTIFLQLGIHLPNVWFWAAHIYTWNQFDLQVLSEENFLVSSEPNFLKDLCPSCLASRVPGSAGTPSSPRRSQAPCPALCPGWAGGMLASLASAKHNTPGLGPGASLACASQESAAI